MRGSRGLYDISFEPILDKTASDRAVTTRNKKESGNFHFDAHLFTILVPIFIPERENSQNGDLVIYPNLIIY